MTEKQRTEILKYLKDNSNKVIGQSRRETIKDIKKAFNIDEDINHIYTQWRMSFTGAKEKPKGEKKVIPREKKKREKFVVVYKNK